jgi:2'-hydroxyisoflavone reductase
MIDTRDLGGWIVRMIEGKRTGIFNTTGPAGKLTWGEWMETCRTVANSDATFTWVSDEFLEQLEIPNPQLPFWVPEAYNGVFAVSVQRAVDAGLTFRPLAETVSDTLDWQATRPQDYALKIGLTPERETELLAAWKEKAISD